MDDQRATESANGSEPGPNGAHDRIRGCLLAAACGDALGAPFEGAQRVDVGAYDAWASHETPETDLTYTDDTALMLTLGFHLAEASDGDPTRLDQDALALAFAHTWAADPHRGYGAGAMRILGEISRGGEWRAAAGGLFGGSGSFGNGGAMRVAPVGLLPSLPLDQVAELARRSAEVTHAHPLALDGAAVQACAVAWAHRSPGDRPVETSAFLAEAASGATGELFRGRLARLETLANREYGPGDVAGELGNDVSALAAVPAALAAFLHAPDDLPAVLRFAVRIGGDTDTIAAMAAGIAGARTGAAAVPAHWVARLECRDRVEELATALSAFTPSG